MPREPATDSQNEFKQIYADYIFKSQQQALDFAQLIVEPDWQVSVRYASERAHWQAVVKRTMAPLYAQIYVWLADLKQRATRFEGQQDGWGKCR